MRGGRTIRSRLAIIVLVPTSLLVTVASFGVADQVRISGDADAVSRLVGLELSAQDLIHSLQRERSLTSSLLGGAGQFRSQVDAQRRATDVNEQSLKQQIAGGTSPSARAVSDALAGLNTLSFIRDSADSGRLNRTEMLDFYTSAIVKLNGFSTEGDLGQSDQALRRDLQSLHSLGEAKEAVALERSQLSGVFAQGYFTQNDYLRFTEVRATKIEALDRFWQTASEQRKSDLTAALKTSQAGLAENFEQKALLGADGSPLKLSSPQWSAAMTTIGNDLREIQRDLGDDIRQRVAGIHRDADRGLFLYSLLALACLIVALLLWLYTFRSIMRPLTMLTGEAHDVAERRLPEAVARVQAADDPGAVMQHVIAGSVLAQRDDEFAEVAVALDHLQKTAVRLAVEQAVMRYNTSESLANLGRRNQNLVRRQLGFISALEKEEADPNQLANLFELDHLATRMRRNAESLLILTGEHSPRRWSTAVSVGDVLRSAFAEVEDYRRVTLRRADKAMVQGAAAAEIAHLLAELVENALAFSPPDLAVEVQARSAGNEYHIAIVDQGLGMAAEAMAVANARLAGEESFLVSPTRDLGHYVVGRLAQRLSIKVWLHDSPLNGVTARVVIPTSLLEQPGKPSAAPRQQVPVSAGVGPHTSGAYLSAPIPGDRTSGQNGSGPHPSSNGSGPAHPASPNGAQPGAANPGTGPNGIYPGGAPNGGANPGTGPNGVYPGDSQTGGAQPGTGPNGIYPGAAQNGGSGAYPAVPGGSQTSGAYSASHGSGAHPAVPPGALSAQPPNGPYSGGMPPQPPGSTGGTPFAPGPLAGPLAKGQPGGGPRHAAPKTTRNGLLKRQPRTPGTRRAGAAQRPATPEQPRPPARPERTPGEVRQMLDSFRLGYNNADTRTGDEPQ
ncbi:sensor histidine kinase [Actinocorallia herbida]|uniref:sensor histidine kinase n=1 Tax=Actinocorallia herbida TaxID=58109 RepID=UPI0014768FD3|nr:nitrate- and nitrite sensing domain-containing protein [Actinocorallia herbida]